MPRSVAVQDLAVESDEDDVVGGDLLEAVGRGLHPDPASIGVPRRDVPPNVVIVAVGAQDATSESHQLAQVHGVRQAL